jgi:hypothetical protein
LDSVVKDKDGTYSKLALQYTTVSEMKKFLEKQNAELNSHLKNPHVAVVTKVQTDTAYFNSKNLSSGDSVYQTVDTTAKPERISVFFRFSDAMYSLHGNTITNPPAAYANVYQNPFKMSLAIDKQEDDFYRIYINFLSLKGDTLNFKVSDIQGAVFKPTIESYSRFGIGLNATTYTFAPGVAYQWGKNQLQLNYKLYDNNSLQTLRWYDRFMITYFRFF